MFTQAAKILQKAQRDNCAVPAFGTFNLEMTQAIVRGAAAKKSPLIILVSPKTIQYSSAEIIVSMVESVIRNETEKIKKIPVALLLDHGKDFQTVKKAVNAGFSSVMIDGSLLAYEKNIALTKKIVDYAHQRGVDVQGELGGVPCAQKKSKKNKSSAENLALDKVDWNKLMTDPDQAKEFVQKTKIDTLAVGIGNAHGFFKERENLDWSRLEKIHQKIKCPLVMHGASDFAYKNAPKAIKGGVVCFNIDTALKKTFSDNLKKFLKKNPDVYDTRVILNSARCAAQKKVEEKIEAFYFSADKK
jgi:ketose-bisphosphate aldolase